MKETAPLTPVDDLKSKIDVDDRLIERELKNLQRVHKKIKSNVFKRFYAFLRYPVIATFVGILITNYYQKTSWERERQYELFKENFDGGIKLVDELSVLVSKRIFGMQRVFWTVKGVKSQEPDSVWANYYETVTEWNVLLQQYKSRIKRYMGVDYAKALENGSSENSLHNHFAATHKQLKMYFDCMKVTCDAGIVSDLENKLYFSFNQLSAFSSDFIERLTKRVYEVAERPI